MTVNSTQILALKKMVFLEKIKSSPPPKKIFFYLFSMQLFSVDAKVFSKKFKKKFWPQKSEKTGQKNCS